MNDLILVQTLKGFRDVHYDLLDDVRLEHPGRECHSGGGYIYTQGLEDETEVRASETLDLKVVDEKGDGCNSLVSLEDSIERQFIRDTAKI